jgi:hypothetical protein
MKLVELAKFLVNEAKTYNQGTLSRKVVPSLIGKEINIQTILLIIDPFIITIKPKMEKNDWNNLNSKLGEFIVVAFDQVSINPDMHEGDGTNLINQNNAEAVLTMFISFVCQPLDLDLNSKDLR